MQLYFIRHGQSENNLAWDQNQSYAGRVPDPDLTALGRQQARAVADYLASSGTEISHLYTSLLLRSVATADVISRRIGLPMRAWIDLHEWGGVYELDLETDRRTGLPANGRSFFEEKFPDLLLPDDLDETGWWNRPWEPFEQVPVRARQVLERLNEHHAETDDRIALVGHAGFYNYLLAALLGYAEEEILHELEKPTWFVLNNGGISRIDFYGDHTSLVYLNRTDHLPDGLLS